MIQPSCVSLTESDLCHQPAFPNTFYHTMQSYVLQVFEIVTTTAAERRTSNRSNLAGSNIQKKRYPSDISSFSHFFESTRRRRTSGGRSPATTGAERRPRTTWSGRTRFNKKGHPSDALFIKRERETGLEPAAPTLARSCSTN